MKGPKRRPRFAPRAVFVMIFAQLSSAIQHRFSRPDPALTSISRMRALSQNDSPVSEISWEQILANIEDGVITLDAAGNVLFFNEAAESLTEISSSRAAQRPLDQLF